MCENARLDDFIAICFNLPFPGADKLEQIHSARHVVDFLKMFGFFLLPKTEKIISFFRPTSSWRCFLFLFPANNRCLSVWVDDEGLQAGIRPDRQFSRLDRNRERARARARSDRTRSACLRVLFESDQPPTYVSGPLWRKIYTVGEITKEQNRHTHTPTMSVSCRFFPHSQLICILLFRVECFIHV